MEASLRDGTGFLSLKKHIKNEKNPIIKIIFCIKTEVCDESVEKYGNVFEFLIMKLIM
jgi:hypothetical protein